MTNTLNTPAEAIELQYPLRVRRFERDARSGGTGEFTGGDGIVREIEALAPLEGTILSDRRVTRPYGLAGGNAADPGENWVILPDQSREMLLPGKARFALQPGQRLRIRTPGGGGWGRADAR
jgi:N-methylhydantoinase B